MWWEVWRCVGGVECDGRVKVCGGRGKACGGRGGGVGRSEVCRKGMLRSVVGGLRCVVQGWRSVVGGLRCVVRGVVCGKE